jgi:alcohol dehydrogenase class IV
MSLSRFSFPTTIHFGPGARALLPTHLKDAGIKRPLIVTDRGIAKLPMLAEMEAALKKVDLAAGTFSEIFGNPVKSQVMKGVNAFRVHQADAIVGFGGGAALDVAKAIAVMIHHPGDLFDYEDDKPGARPFDREIPYIVAVPTTSGTGSEVGRSAVVSDDETHLKKIIFSPKLLAKAVFADPELTYGLPDIVTATTGMDALTHCVEAYLAKGYHPICEGIALEGFKLSAKNLASAVKDPRNPASRGGMMMSSMMGAIAFQKGLGIVHSCAHALRHNFSAVPGKFSELAYAAGLRTSGATEACEGFVGWLKDLKKQVGIPQSLRAAGVKSEQIQKLADIAAVDACHPSNPRPCSREDFVKVFTEAMG